jgi:hypothetical protein
MVGLFSLPSFQSFDEIFLFLVVSSLFMEGIAFKIAGAFLGVS